MFEIISEGVSLDLTPNQDITISITNAFFESERIPVPVSTTIEFRPTAKNRGKFKFASGPLSKPMRDKLPAIIMIAGLPLWIGELQHEELADNSSLNYTFVGATFEDVISGKLTDVKFPPYQNVDYTSLVSHARKGQCNEFGLPMLVRKTLAAKNDYRTSTSPNAFPECSSIDKYANWICSDTPYFIPAIKFNFILGQILPNLIITAPEISRLVDYLVILGLHKNKKLENRWGIDCVSFRTDGAPAECNINIADSLPEMTSKDFILNLLKMTCSTLYCYDGKYEIHSNKSIIASQEYTNWSNKISDTYSCSRENGQGYSFSYKNESDTYEKKYSNEPGHTPENDYIQLAYSMEEIFDQIRASPELKTIRHAITKDIFTGKKTEALLYYTFDLNTSSYIVWNTYKTVVPLLDQPHHADFAKRNISGENSSNDNDCSVDFEIPRCMPIWSYPLCFYEKNTGIYQLNGKRTMAPSIEFPALGGTRSTNAYIGLLIENNFIDKGIYFTRPVNDVDSGAETSIDLSLALDGPNNIFDLLHKPYAEWFLKKKDPRKIELNLTPHDIANLQLWSKYMFYHQLFLFRSIDFSFNTSATHITTEAEIIEA